MSLMSLKRDTSIAKFRFSISSLMKLIGIPQFLSYVEILHPVNKSVSSKKKMAISSQQNIVYIGEGWGTSNPGWWKKGTYEWVVSVDGEKIGDVKFYIVDGGPVTPVENPYFLIEDVKLFESSRFGIPVEERKYLAVFSSAITRFVNVEFRLQNLYLEREIFPIELTINVFNDSGQFKAGMNYMHEFKNALPNLILDTGYGADKPGFWYPDQYTLEVIFMDQMIAVVPFEVAEEEELLEGKQVYSEPSTISESEEEIEENLSFEEAKTELEALIGLKTVKRQINDLATYLQFLKIRQEKGIEDRQELSLHSVFTGNPGTGKTTVASMLGKIYKSLGLLSLGGVIEVGRAELVGEFIGQTAPKVKKLLEKARGGILFIDEAYALTNRGKDGKDFGAEVVEILLKELSDGVGDIAIIFAGYPKEMKQFLLSNPGLASRLKNIIHFPDYAPDELLEIAEYAAGKRGVVLSQDATNKLHKRLVEAYRNRDDQFGNARYVIGIVEESKQHMALRLMKKGDEVEALDVELLSTISMDDVNAVFSEGVDGVISLPIDEALLKDSLNQLHQLVGLDQIKKEVDEMVKLVRYYKEIGKDIKNSFSLHSVFLGNPGTGKTTLARIIVRIYKSLGILERGHLVEVDRKSMVAGYVGQTAIKAGNMIDKAMGGGLFIDEAYALTRGGANDFGREAIETLLKRMEDQRGEFMVIVAGYPDEMRQFIEANPGLMSRFDKQYIFQDYSDAELFLIAKKMFNNEDLELSEDAFEHVRNYIQKLVESKHKYFGNARTIRKIVSEAIRNQHLRMADLPKAKRTKKAIRTIIASDLSGFKLMEEEPEQKKGIGFR